MNVKLLILSAVTSLLCFAHAPAFAFGAKTAGVVVSDDSGRFKIAGNILSTQQQFLQQDLRFLQTKKFSNPDSDLNSLMHISSTNGDLMESWLADRVQIIVGENLDVGKSLSVVQEGYGFENPGVFPTQEQPSAANGSILDWLLPKKDSVVMVMQNLGAALYMLGKEHNALLGFKVPNGDLVAISSPRTGIIQVGEGLFQNHDPDSKNLDSMSNRLFRLATFFHEAHHSDGNGQSLSFEHALCPAGHLYAGYYACDRNLNGPYTIGATVMRMFASNCSECSVKQIEELQLDSLDSFSRIIVQTMNDPTMDAEESAQMESGECQYVLAHPELKISAQSVAKICMSQDINAEQIAKISTSSTIWDEQPEGSR